MSEFQGSEQPGSPVRAPRKLSRSGRTRVLSALLTAVGFAQCLDADSAAAQSAVLRPDPIPDFGRITATSDDSTALHSNPANLAFMRGHELRWSSTYLDEALGVPWQGHALGFATPLGFLDIATGLRVDWVMPPAGATPSASFNYQWLTWGLAVPLGSSSALGASLSGSFSNGAFGGGLTSITVGYSVRPFNGLALSFIVHDANAPSNRFFEYGRSWNVAGAIRPLGTRALEVGLESAYLENEDIWAPSAQLGVDLGPVGRLRGSFAWNDPTRESRRSWLASLGLSVYVNGIGGSGEVTGGALTGNATGADNRYSGYLSVATRGFREVVGVEPGRVAIKLRLEDTPSDRDHVTLLRQLWSIAKEPNVDAVAFELRASPANSLAHLEELRDAAFNLRRAGKRVLCHLEDANGGALYFCAAANRIAVNPAGGIRFAGMHSEQLYLARLLENVGVGADFVRVGAHKSAPEQFTNSGASDVARADRIDLLQQFERHFTEGVSVGRGMSFDQVRSRVGDGPFTASEAKAAGFIDSLTFDDEIEKEVQGLTGRSQPLLSDNRAPRVPRDFGKCGGVAVVHVNGDLIDGRSRTVPLLGMELAGSYSLADTLKAVRDDRRVRAVVLRIESPGGSSVAADVLWRQVKLLAQVKPTVVSMGSVAASGGYAIAAPATRIFANPSTVTGSIGVFYGKADASKLLSRIGVDVETYRTHEFADTDSMYRGFTPEERTRLQGKIEQFYRTFVEHVAEGRKLDPARVDELGQGRVWSGEQAVKNGLADELGGLRQALAYARKAAGLEDDSPVVELPKIEESLLSRLIGIPGLAQSLYDAPMPRGMTQTLKALGPFLVFDGDTPLARLEIALPELP